MDKYDIFAGIIALIGVGGYLYFMQKDERRKQEVHEFAMQHNQAVADIMKTKFMEAQFNDQ